MLKSWLARIRPYALVAGFGGALLLPAAALVVDRALGEEVRLIAAHDPSTIEINQALHLPGDPVAEIYGNPLSTPLRVIAPDASRLVRPEEDRSLVLLAVNKQRGENPLQARTVWFFTRFGTAGLLLLGLLALAFPRRRFSPRPVRP